jgi:hypothetical protein
MRPYAEGTSVSVESTRAAIDALLVKNGATSTAILNSDEDSRAAVAFTMKGARFRIEIPLPTLADVEPPSASKQPKNLTRDQWLAQRLVQARRERWRAILLLLKSKLEIVRIGLSGVEKEFMADMILPGGETVHQVLSEALRRGLDGAALPKALGVGTMTEERV